MAKIKAIGDSEYGKLEEQHLKNALINEDVQVEKCGQNFKITFNKNSKKYRLTKNGEIKSLEEMEPTAIYVKLESDGTLKLRATKLDGYEEGKKWNSPKILKVIIEEPIAPKTASEMFSNCYNLAVIENIENLHTENTTSMYYMFYDCNKLEELDLSNFETGKVTSMRAMFGQCHKLKTLDLSNFDTKNVNNMINMFYGCNNLTSLDLSGFNTEKVIAMGWMFRACNSLTSINLKNLDTANVTSMDLMFQSCGKLTTIDLSSFNTSKVTTMGMMFNGCGVVDINFDNFDMSSVTNMSAMFRSCKNLSNQSLNSILNMCKKTTKITNKTLKDMEVPSAKAQTCKTLSNYSAFIESGWTIGY